MTTVLRNDYFGGAAGTTAATNIDVSDNSITVVTGGLASWGPVVHGRFLVVINHGEVDEERCYATGFAGDVISGLTRGEDETVQRSHDAGATITHGLAAADVDTPNEFLASPTAAGQVAVSDGVGSWGAPTDTLANLTLTSPTIDTPTINDPTLSNGYVAPDRLFAPAAVTPAQTAQGEMVWDDDDGVLTVGTGSGRKTMVDTDTAQTLANKTLTTPVIADFTNAQHDHGDANDGGVLPASASEGFWLGPSRPSTWLTNTVVAANRALYARIRPTADVTVSAIWFAIAVGAGNVDVGVYADASGAPGAKIVTSGSTASPGAGLHSIAVTPTVLTAGTTYWIAFAMSSATLSLVCTATTYGSFGLSTVFAGEHTSGFPLPATASAITADAISQGMAVGVLLP